MANVVSSKTFKIKPENQVAAEGVIANCKYAGAVTTGFGPISKTTYVYKVYIEVEGLDKLIVIKVKQKDGWNADIVNTINILSRNKQMPVNIGDKISIVYDRIKPKKCNVVQ